MQYRDLVLILFAALLLSTACRDRNSVDDVLESVPIAIAGAEDIISVAELSLVAFESGSSSRGIDLTDSGMTVLESMDSAELIPPIVTAAHPFNYIFPEWKATVPVSSTVQIRIRTAMLDGEWTDWQTAEYYPDGVVEGSDFTPGGMIDTGGATTRHERAQVEIVLKSSPTGEDPVLEGVNLVFVDSTTGKTTQEILREMESTDGKRLVRTNDDYPKPRIVPRSQWCSHPDCVYSSGINYAPVSHLIVHHTVSNNATTDWATNVRGIWSFHTFNRGWGDVGYNYLIDPNGVIYEGHIGGDNVIGTHAAEANNGSMGVALLGTFGTVRPNATMLNALADLIAWKADQRDIDMWGASRLPLFDSGHLHLMGHRDVYGTTECPGSLAHAEISQIRQLAADKMNFTSDYTYFDNRDSQFTQANANWHTGPFACGFNANSIYTFSTTDASIAVNWGEWRPDIPTTGAYQVDAYVPFCRTGLAESRQAPYQITHAGGTTNVVRNQDANLGLWMSLGEYNFAVGGNNVIRLNDLTSSENNVPILFDAIRIKPLNASAANTIPSDDQWLTDRDVTFRWRLTADGVLTQQRVQVATDPNFENIVLNRTVATNVRLLRHTFDQDYADLYWRVVATKAGGSQIISAGTSFHLDAAPPTSQIHTVLIQCDGTVTLQWFGEDAVSGVASYDVEYKRSADASWTRIASDTTETNLNFTPPDQTSTYRYRVQAVDRRGNIEPLKANGDIGTEQAIPCNILAPTNVFPPDTTGWINQNPVTFEWNIDAPQAVALYKIEVATDQGFNNLVVSQLLPARVNEYQHEFGQDYTQLYWRVTATTVFDESVTSAPTSFRFDATAPSAEVTTANQQANGNYLLNWRGSDALSGLASYTIQYRGEEASNWTNLVVNTTENSGTFNPVNNNGTYLFRARATDWAGNVESAESSSDFSTARGCPYTTDPARHTSPTNDQWRNSRAVALRWSAPRARCIKRSVVEIATNSAFNNIIHTSPTISAARTSYDYISNRSYSQLYWRVRYTTVVDESFTSTPTRIRFDIVAPSAQITRVQRQPDTLELLVSATATDFESGVTRYIFEYREEGTNDWKRFAAGRDDEALFALPDPNAAYWLRVRAVDAAGNLSAGNITGDVSTAQISGIHTYYFPIISRE
ncbi:MAG: N-acetylmuramoyl-L-alanine amidase [Candidatus Promineifilaceae bacterium]